MPNNIEDIKSLIKNTSKRLEIAKADKKVLQNKLNKNFEDDKTWKEEHDKMSAAKRSRHYRELELIQEKKLDGLVEQIDDQKENIKDLKIALSDYLSQYLKETGESCFEFDGHSITVVQKYSFKPQQMRLFS